MKKEILRIYPELETIYLIGGDGTTNPDKILSYYKQNNDNKLPIFFITTYSSCHLLVKPDYKFDFKIGDERFIGDFPIIVILGFK